MMKDYSGIDFLWTWARIGKRDNRMLKEVYSQHALLCSTLSVQKFYPGARRRLFLDQETYDFFEEKGWLELWDEVKVFELPDTLGAKRYHAYPKLYTYRFIERPTFIIDVEVICKSPIPLKDPTKVVSHWWTDNQLYYLKKNWIKDQDYWPDAKDRFISAGFYYIPGPEVAKAVATKVCNRVDKIAEYCKFGPDEPGWQVYVEDGILTHWFKELCGIRYLGLFDSNDEYMYNAICVKYQNYDSITRLKAVDIRCEKEAGLEGVYDKYFKKKIKRVL